MPSDAVPTQEDQTNTDNVVTIQEDQLNGGKLFQTKLQIADSFDIESGSIAGHHHHSGVTAVGGAAGLAAMLQLAFQSIGVVYGDLGTSPLYVFSSTFTHGIKHNDDIIGVLSLVFYTLTLIPLIKYVFIVLRANDNGNGGTFALYSLICRYTKVGLIPSEKEVEVSNSQPNKRMKRASKLQTKVESSNFAKNILLFATMLGTSMVIGDGVLTPCISVTSAVSGLKQATSHVTEGVIVWTSVIILILLFTFQRFGTHRVGSTFAPVLLIWFFSIAGVGVFNFFKHDPSVIRALNPQYIADYFARNKTSAWLSLGGVVLCTTGCEALFADVGHFSVESIQLGTCTVVYPSIVLAYFGQASFLRKHNESVSNAFYASIPEKVYWPMFVVAVLAAIIASQALITGTFSMIQQSLSLGCFPRVKVVHTSTKHPGQVYIPEVNYILMFACVLFTLVFRTSTDMSNAYGIVVVFVMTLTSAFLILIMIMIWKTNILLVMLYILVFLSIELLYLTSVLSKFTQGGYLPLLLAFLLVTIMYVWNHVYRKKYYYELANKISPENLKELLMEETNSQRLKGLAMFYSEVDQDYTIPPIFKHYVNNVPALHSVLVFVSFKFLPIHTVPVEERFLFQKVEPEDLRVFCCVVRCGYEDTGSEDGGQLDQLMYEKLREFIQEGGGEDMVRSIQDVDGAWLNGVVHLVGEEEVAAAKSAGFFTKMVIDYAYDFLKRNLRQSNRVFHIPHAKMIKVGMVVEL